MSDEQLHEAYRHGDLRARDALAEKFYDKAVAIAVEVSKTLPPSIHRDEVIGYAHDGLLKAIDQWDVARGVPFPKFVKQKVKWTIYEGLREESGMRTQSRDRTKTKAFSSMPSVKCDDQLYPFEGSLIDENAKDPADKILAEQIWDDIITTSESGWDRQLLCGHFKYGMTMVHIGERVGLTKSAVSLNMTGALKELRIRIHSPQTERKRTIRPAFGVCLVSCCNNEHHIDGLCIEHSSHFATHGELQTTVAA